jgi:hypothetical protein
VLLKPIAFELSDSLAKPLGIVIGGCVVQSVIVASASSEGVAAGETTCCNFDSRATSRRKTLGSRRGKSDTTDKSQHIHAGDIHDQHPPVKEAENWFADSR